MGFSIEAQVYYILDYLGAGGRILSRTGGLEKQNRRAPMAFQCFQMRVRFENRPMQLVSTRIHPMVMGLETRTGGSATGQKRGGVGCVVPDQNELIMHLLWVAEMRSQNGFRDRYLMRAPRVCWADRTQR
jgi:hypothetical protein